MENFKVTTEVKGDVAIVYINDIVHLGIPNVNKLVGFVSYYNGANEKRIDLSFSNQTEIKLSYDSHDKWVKILDALTELIFKI